MSDPSDLLTIVGASAGGGSGVALIVAVTRWLGTRAIQKEDEANRGRDARLTTLETEHADMKERMTRLDERLAGTARELGRHENESARLAGKIDGLQSDWRGRFEKLQDELRLRDERLAEKIIEAKGENMKGLAELRETFEGYRRTMHERLGEITKLIISSHVEMGEAYEVLRENAAARRKKEENPG
jgi:hypothetical protein